MSANYSPHVSRFSACLVARERNDDYAFREAEDELSIMYQPILAEAKVRLLELRKDWSEIGALHQLRDELCAAWSLYTYIIGYAGWVAEKLQAATGDEGNAAVHPKARDYMLKDKEVFDKWLKLSPFASSILPSMAVDQYWNKHCDIQVRLRDIRIQEELSEIGSLYFLIEEMTAEVAAQKWKARRATWNFFQSYAPACPIGYSLH